MSTLLSLSAPYLLVLGLLILSILTRPPKK